MFTALCILILASSTIFLCNFVLKVLSDSMLLSFDVFNTLILFVGPEHPDSHTKGCFNLLSYPMPLIVIASIDSLER